MAEAEPRRRVIEVIPAAKSPVIPAPVKKQREVDEEAQFQIPLELWPVIRTLMGYGRRIHGLGALRGASALERVIDSLIPHVAEVPELLDVIVLARNEAEEIRRFAMSATTGEQDDEDNT